jgi:hypothetical protein
LLWLRLLLGSGKGAHNDREAAQLPPGSHGQSVTMLATADVIDYSHRIDRGMPSMAGITAKRN